MNELDINEFDSNQTNQYLNEENKIHKQLQEASNAYGKLIKQGTFIPHWFIQAMEEGLVGKPLPDSKKIEIMSRTEIYDVLKNNDTLKQFDIYPSKEEIKLIHQSIDFLDDILSKTLRMHYGWGIPSEESISMITTWLKDNHMPGLLEIGAGSGLWSAVIQSRVKKPVIACEINRRSDTPKPKFFDVLNQTGESLLHQYPDFPILIVWADVNDISIKMAEQLSTNNYLILSGPIGVTANKEFYRYLDAHFDIINQCISSTFSGSEDTTFILKKLPKPKKEYDTFFSHEKEHGHYTIKSKQNSIRKKYS